MTTSVSHSYDRSPAIYNPGDLVTLGVKVASDQAAGPDERVTIQTITRVIGEDGAVKDEVISSSEYVVRTPGSIFRTEPPVDSSGRTWDWWGRDRHDEFFQTRA